MEISSSLEDFKPKKKLQEFRGHPWNYTPKNLIHKKRLAISILLKLLRYLKFETTNVYLKILPIEFLQIPWFFFIIFCKFNFFLVQINTKYMSGGYCSWLNFRKWDISDRFETSYTHVF